MSWSYFEQIWYGIGHSRVTSQYLYQTNEKLYELNKVRHTLNMNCVSDTKDNMDYKKKCDYVSELILPLYYKSSRDVILFTFTQVIFNLLV